MTGNGLRDASTSLAPWCKGVRADAEARLQEAGLPQARDEYWKFTNPRHFSRNQNGQPSPVRARNAGRQVKATGTSPEMGSFFAAFAENPVEFIDGHLASLPDKIAPNLEIEALHAAFGQETHWCSELFGKLESGGQKPVLRPYAIENTAQATEGLVIRARDRVPHALPVAYRRLQPDAASFIRLVIKIEAGSELTLLEFGPTASFLNKVIEVDVSDGGIFRHVCIHGRDHERRTLSHIFADLGEGSSFKTFTLTANGQASRNEVYVRLKGPNGAAHLSGAAIGDGDFHHDDTVFVEHIAPHCESRQVFKKVLRNGAVGVFQGKIFVRPHSQKTDGYQLSQALLLDEFSQFLAKPELEIYADDVACSHGSTCGSLDEDALFYLRSRGIPQDEAQDMLTLSFLADVFSEIDDPDLSEAVVALLKDWIARHH